MSKLLNLKNLAQIEFPAPAKINLFLHIVDRYQTGPFKGYHQLQTVFQFLDWCDSLQFNLRPDEQIQVNTIGADIPLGDHLVYKAAKVLHQIVQNQQRTVAGVNIKLHKRIPIGAGLGGGSSNAATTLVVLNELWQLNLAKSELIHLGAQLGADIPIFIHGHAAFADGIGEQLTSISLSEPWYVVIVPPVSIATAKIFNDPSLTRNTTKVKITQFFEGFGRNDCEPVVCQHYPLVGQALTWLAQFTPSRLTGTGSAVFGAFPDKEVAESIQAQVPEPFTSFVARGLCLSPLQQYI